MKHILLSLLLAVLVAGMILGGTVSNGQKVSAGESSPADEQAQIDLIKKMENERIQAGVPKDVDALAPVEVIPSFRSGELAPMLDTTPELMPSVVKLMQPTLARQPFSNPAP